MNPEDRIRQKLLKEKKRRDKRPAPNLDFGVSLTISPAKRDAFTQAHAPVLLKIETCINQMWHDHEELDDRHVVDALSAAIRNQPDSDPLTSELIRRLATVFTAVFGTPDARETWVTGLRCIYTSVKTRSRCGRGDRDYLDFASTFIGNAGQM